MRCPIPTKTQITRKTMHNGISSGKKGKARMSGLDYKGKTPKNKLWGLKCIYILYNSQLLNLGWSRRVLWLSWFSLKVKFLVFRIRLRRYLRSWTSCSGNKKWSACSSHSEADLWVDLGGPDWQKAQPFRFMIVASSIEFELFFCFLGMIRIMYQ